jgi:hypothetical protein
MITVPSLRLVFPGLSIKGLLYAGHVRGEYVVGLLPLVLGVDLLCPVLTPPPLILGQCTPQAARGVYASPGWYLQGIRQQHAYAASL